MVQPVRFDGSPVPNLRAVGAIAPASMQFIDLEPAFGTLAHIVVPGGYMALKPRVPQFGLKRTAG